jgi:putative chitinase
MALATVAAETWGTGRLLSEPESRFNTAPDAAPFSLYDNRQDLGNEGPPDGERFRGRGYLMITGRRYYTEFSERLGLGKRLVDDPDSALDPDIAARMVAMAIKSRASALQTALRSPSARSPRPGSR